MAGKTVGELQIELKMDGDNLSAQLKNVEKKVEKDGGSSGGKFANAFTVAMGNVLSAGIGKAIDVVTSHMDSAIKRVDTIRNFPNVMSNLGISADKSEKAMAKLKEALQGVPTNLDDAAAAVQRFTSKNGDVEKSSDLFLALNDALLAGGMSSEIQATAMEQLSQAYSKGKPDMIEWRSLLTAMPAQVKQIAIAMGFGEDGVDALGEALRTGSVSMDDFMNTIVKLDSEGVAGLKSFREQMEGTTGGIQRSINVMNSRITQGVAEMIEDIGPDRIADMVLMIGNAVKELAVQFAPLVGDLAGKIVPKLGELAGKILPPMTKFLMSLAEAGMAIFEAFEPVLDFILDGIVNFFNFLAANSGVVQVIFVGLAATAGVLYAISNAVPFIIAGIFLLISHIGEIWEIIKMVGGEILNFLKGVWDGIVAIFNGVVGFFTSIFQGAWNAIKSIFGKVVDWFKGIFNGIVNVFKTVGTTIGNAVGGAFKAVVNGIIGFAEKFVNAPIKAINALIDVINAVPGISLGKLTELKLPRMAQGGLVTASTVANIGENGREAVLPLDRNTDNWSGLLASALADEFEARGGGGGGGITIEKQIFDISSEMDADDIGRKVMNSLRRAA